MTGFGAFGYPGKVTPRMPRFGFACDTPTPSVCRVPSPSSNDAELPVALTIAGSDSGAGAGVQADLLTFAANGVFGTTAVTCLTAQNPDGVTGVVAVDAGMVRAQAEQVAGFFKLRAAKTGMLYDASIIDEVASFFESRPALPVVVDPVMVSTSGARLLKEDAIASLREKLIPRARVVTPNLDEAAVLIGERPSNADAVERVAIRLSLKHGVPFLVKGGHLHGDSVVDVLAVPGARAVRFTGERIPGVDTHGSGCTLSAAIAAHLALGMSLEDAVAAGRAYLRDGIASAISASGRRFISHFP